MSEMIFFSILGCDWCHVLELLKGSQSQKPQFYTSMTAFYLVTERHQGTAEKDISKKKTFWPTDLPATPCGKRREGICMLVDLRQLQNTEMFLLLQWGQIRHKLDKQDINVVNLDTTKYKSSDDNWLNYASTWEKVKIWQIVCVF